MLFHTLFMNSGSMMISRYGTAPSAPSRYAAPHMRNSSGWHSPTMMDMTAPRGMRAASYQKLTSEYSRMLSTMASFFTPPMP